MLVHVVYGNQPINVRVELSCGQRPIGSTSDTRGFDRAMYVPRPPRQCVRWIEIIYTFRTVPTDHCEGNHVL